jgi:hypothetical protein
MRLASVLAALSLVAFFTQTGCAVRAEITSEEPLPVPAGPSALPTEPDPTPSAPGFVPAAPAAPADDGAFAEVVHVYMRARDRSEWMCTGTLVGPRTVVTAAHCLDPASFVAYQIVAANVPGSPRVAASTPRIFGGSYEDVANPDIGLLTLASAVTLPRYAELTDVTARVEAGEALSVAAVVRTSEDGDAPFAATDPMSLSSAVPYGYAHGFATPMFSKGGDSGAGFFLIEDGKRTHKLVGVARQPEPERGLDHLTRIDAAFLGFVAGSVN